MFSHERKDRFLGDRKTSIDYLRGWWNGLQGSPFHKEGPMDAKDLN